MIVSTLATRPPRSFLVLVTVLAVAGIVAGVAVATPQRFHLLMAWATGIGSLAAGVASQFHTTWGRGQRALLLLAAFSLAVAFGVLARFIF